MFKTVLQAFKKVKWKKVGKGIYKWAQILAPVLVLGLTIYLGFTLKTDEYFQGWEQACVYSTLIYTALIFVTGLLGDKFEGVSRKQGVIISLLLFGVILCAISTLKEELVFIEVSLNRTGLMVLYCAISWCYLAVNIVLITANIPEKDEIINSIKYCEGPISLTFIILAIYALDLYCRQSDDPGINPFFSGAVAFQMILSNVIWGIIDNNQRVKKILITQKILIKE